MSSSGLLPDHIGPLVDRLRTGDHLPIALPDVAAVTEVLMRSLESYFKSIDLTLYKECQDLADYIENARTEISSLSPEHDDSAGIPRAGLELDAIVEATESATETIMQSAEDIMSFDSENFDEYKDHINNEVMKIFEACSFQDITGQRISKVVKTLNHVEERVGKLITILGLSSVDANSNSKKPIVDPEDFSDKDLLNGPALAGEGIDQGEVDSLLDNFEPEAIDDNLNDQTDNHPMDDGVQATLDDQVYSNIDEAIDENIENQTQADLDIEFETVEQEDDIDAISFEELEQEEQILESNETEMLTKKPKEENVSEKETAQKTSRKDSILKQAVVETSQEDIDNLFG